MKSNERGRDSFSDAAMDALLKDFFEKEMPAELRQSTDRACLVTIASSDERPKSRRAGWVGVSVAAASLLTVAVLLSQPGNRPSGHSGLTARNVRANGPKPTEGIAEVAEPSDANVKITVTEDFNDVDQYDTANGPVEQRSKLRIKNVSIVDPETGAKVELSLPELEIEIFPIDDGKSDKDGAKDE